MLEISTHAPNKLYVVVTVQGGKPSHILCALFPFRDKNNPENDTELERAIYFLSHEIRG